MICISLEEVTYWMGVEGGASWDWRIEPPHHRLQPPLLSCRGNMRLSVLPQSLPLGLILTKTSREILQATVQASWIDWFAEGIEVELKRNRQYRELIIYSIVSRTISPSNEGLWSLHFSLNIPRIYKLWAT